MLKYDRRAFNPKVGGSRPPGPPGLLKQWQSAIVGKVSDKQFLLSDFAAFVATRIYLREQQNKVKDECKNCLVATARCEGRQAKHPKIGDSSNGRTPVFGTGYAGSIPASPATFYPQV